ncbi:Hypothetical protein GLP15_3800 [Giardia lamblia P15]|uniref:Leucine-rich repeat protein n=1 Tax=Giardia intestinalis (strain P15) TaxID=658858 RepID=E1F250_GIAIA|nr:Hypothetical protein GLP15_3800 [Giardia lamblia P15]
MRDVTLQDLIQHSSLYVTGGCSIETAMAIIRRLTPFEQQELQTRRAYLSRIVSLNLTALGLKHAHAYIGNCTSLAFLYLPYNELYDVWNIALTPSILRLDLRCNKLDNLGNYNYWSLASQLRALHLDNNNLPLAAFEALSPLSNLVILTCTNNPALESPHFRHYIVNLLPSLQFLNGSVVSLVERVSYLNMSDNLLQGLSLNIRYIESCPSPLSLDASSLEHLKDCYTRYCGVIYDSEKPIKDLTDPFAFDAYNVEILRDDLRAIAATYQRMCPIVTLQRICKGFIVQARWKTVRCHRSHAATKIQAFYRMLKIYTHYSSKIKLRILATKRAILTIQRIYRCMVATWNTQQKYREESRRERAATMIARAYRRMANLQLQRSSVSDAFQRNNELKNLRLYVARVGDKYSNLIAIFEQLVQIILSELQISIFAYPDARPEELSFYTNHKVGAFSATLTDYQLLKAVPSISMRTGEVFDICIKKRNFKTFAAAYSIIANSPYETPNDTLHNMTLARATSFSTKDLHNSLYQRVMRRLESIDLPESTQKAHWDAADGTDMPFILQLNFQLYCISSLFRYLLSEFQLISFASFYPEDMVSDIEKSITVGRTIATKHLSHSLYQELISLVTTGCFSNNISISSYRKRAKEKRSLIVLLTEHALVQISAACSIQSLFRMWRSNMMFTPLELFGYHIEEYSVSPEHRSTLADHSRRDSAFASVNANLIAAPNPQQLTNMASRSTSRLSVFASAPSIDDWKAHLNEHDDGVKSSSSTINTSVLSEPLVSLQATGDLDYEDTRFSNYYLLDDKTTVSKDAPYQGDPVPIQPHHIFLAKSIDSEQDMYSGTPICTHPYPIIRLAIRVSRAAQIIQRNFRRILARMRLLVTLKARAVFVDIARNGFFLISQTVASHLFDNCLLNPQSTRKLPHVTSYLGEHSYITLLPPLSEKFKQHIQQLDTLHCNASFTKPETNSKEELAARKQKRAKVLAEACDWSLSTGWVFRGYYGSDIVTTIGFEYQLDAASSQLFKKDPEALVRRPKSKLERRSTQLNMNVLQNLNYNRIFGHPFLRQWGAVEVYSSRCYINSVLSANSLYCHYLRSFSQDSQRGAVQGMRGAGDKEQLYNQSDFNFFALPMVAGESKKASQSISAQIVCGLRSISSLAVGINGDDTENQFEMILDCDPFRTFCNDSRLSYFPRKEHNETILEDVTPYIRYNMKATIRNNLRIIKEGLVFSLPSKELFSTTLFDDFQYVTGGLYCVTHRPGCSIPDLAFKAALLEIWFCDPFRYNYSTASLSSMCRTFLGSPGIILTPNSVIMTLATLSIQRIMRGHLVRKRLSITRNVHALVKLQDYVDVPVRSAFREKYAIQMIKSIVEPPKKPINALQLGNFCRQPVHTLSASALPPTPRKLTPRNTDSSMTYLQPAQIRAKPRLSYNTMEIVREGQRVGVLPLVLKSNMHPIDVRTDIDSKTYSLDALDTYAKTGTNPASNEAHLLEAFYKASRELGQTMNTRTNKITVAGVREATIIDPRPIENAQKATLLLNELKDLTTKQSTPMPVHDRLRLQDYYRNKIMLPMELHQFVAQHTTKTGYNDHRSSSKSTTSSVHRDVESTSSNSSVVLGGTMKELTALNREVERFSLEEDRLTELRNDYSFSDPEDDDLTCTDHCSSFSNQLGHLRTQFTEMEELAIQTQLRRTILEKGTAIAKEHCAQHKIALAKDVITSSSKLKEEAEVRRTYEHVEQMKLRTKVHNSKAIAKCGAVGKHLAGDLIARMRKLDSVLRSDCASCKNILDN